MYKYKKLKANMLDNWHWDVNVLASEGWRIMQIIPINNTIEILIVLEKEE